jgi:hypothetical protein
MGLLLDYSEEHRVALAAEGAFGADYVAQGSSGLNGFGETMRIGGSSV